MSFGSSNILDLPAVELLEEPGGMVKFPAFPEWRIHGQ
jgi:hypothetical protein